MGHGTTVVQPNWTEMTTSKCVRPAPRPPLPGALISLSSTVSRKALLIAKGACHSLYIYCRLPALPSTSRRPGRLSSDKQSPPDGRRAAGGGKGREGKQTGIQVWQAEQAGPRRVQEFGPEGGRGGQRLEWARERRRASDDAVWILLDVVSLGPRDRETGG